VDGWRRSGGTAFLGDERGCRKGGDDGDGAHWVKKVDGNYVFVTYIGFGKHLGNCGEAVSTLCV
jgi:hypothetical protein